MGDVDPKKEKKGFPKIALGKTSIIMTEVSLA